MLHFKLDLEGTFIQNLRAYQFIMKMCAMQKMSSNLARRQHEQIHAHSQPS